MSDPPSPAWDDVKRVLRDRVVPPLDRGLAPFVWPAAFFLGALRAVGLERLPRCRAALLSLGVIPVRTHYYEPFAQVGSGRRGSTGERSLPGIDWSVAEQLRTLERLAPFARELTDLTAPPTSPLDFRLGNGRFEAGDAEYWYATLRARRPRTVIEVGSGHSTRLAARALARTAREVPGYACRHVCIEPYEMPWLEQLGVTVIRERVEVVGLAPFRELEPGDVVFIDSSHVVRPGGDVLFELLELLPTLPVGVLVHVHDVFSPRDYPRPWLEEQLLLWNEQYLLEAFLSGNRDWKVVGALNLLHHRHHEALATVCPYLDRGSAPGSFYLERVR